mmetsp:Transcript_371/g.439  ORF Transcript_371/g.439 Transcript_371/m.439 type:complete len:209 (-) Transcript_371:26-652(-)
MKTRVTKAQLYEAKLAIGVNDRVVNDTLTEHKEFMTSISKGNISIAMRKLDEEPALVETPLDYEGNKPLHIAALNGYYALAERLIERGADPNAKNVWDQTPLFMAALNYINNDNIELVFNMLNYGCDPRVTVKVILRQGTQVLKLILDYVDVSEAQALLQQKFKEATAHCKDYPDSWKNRKGLLWVLSKLREADCLRSAKPQLISRKA